MAKHETTEQQPRKRSRAGIVLLVLLLLLIGGAGYLYYSVVKAPLALDDPRQMAASAPMSAGERFRFSSADGTVQVKINAADIWNLILENTGADFMDIINERLSSYDLYLSGCGIQMDEEGLMVNLELFWRETRLVARIPCSLEITGRHLSLVPTGLKLGVVSLPVENVLSSLKLEYDMNLPVISDVTQVSFVQNAIVLTGTMEEDVRNLVPVDEKLYQTAVFADSLQPLADALQTEEGYAAILSHLEQNPGSVEALYRELFILAKPEVTGEYLDSRFGLTQRFLPGIDFSAAEEEQTALTEQLNAKSISLEQFFTELVCDYNDKKFRLSEGEFLLWGKPFRAADYGGGKYDTLFELLDPESVFLILVDAEDGHIRKTSSFYRMADENQQFTQTVDYNKTYILGCVLRSVDGDPFLMYESEIRYEGSYSRRITLLPLTEADVQELQVTGKFGVWTG